MTMLARLMNGGRGFGSARCRAASLLVGVVCFGGSAQAQLTFQIDFGTDSGTGFIDPTFGAERQQALLSAADAFSSMFDSHFNNPATIQLLATAVPTGVAFFSNTLFSSGTAGFTATNVVQPKLQGGVDLNGSAADGVINVNFAQPWQLNPNTTPASGQIDFFGVAYHEFTHALGFYSAIGQDGSPAFGSKSAGEWASFERFLTDRNGTKVVNTDFSLNQRVWDAASVGGASPADGLFFDGSFAKAANGGSLVGLYSPANWLEGSSASHLDTDNAALAGSMMLHSVVAGRTLARDYSAIEVGMLRDLGYTASVVPEPSPWVLMVAGLGLVGGLSRRPGRRAGAWQPA